jgi:class 3 adenylate cyclase
MKGLIIRLTALLLFLLPSAARAQENPAYREVHLRPADMPLTLNKSWRYHPGDNPAWAAPGYDDSAWISSTTQFYVGGPAARILPFPGLAWFRTGIVVDSALAGRLLSLTMEHEAAADLFIDGQPVKAMGKQGGSGFKSPIIFTFPRPGRYVLAVRFADPAMSTETGNWDHVGFRMVIQAAPEGIEAFRNGLSLIISLLVLFIVFFGSFGLLHLIMFLYYRAERSNAYFSLFCLSVALFFLAVYLGFGLDSNTVNALMKGRAGFFVGAIFLTLSAFINQLFGAGRLRFLLARVGLAALILAAIFLPLSDYVQPALVTLVCIEAVVLILRAMIRKAPGASIIGTGILIFAVFVIGLAILLSAGPSVAYDFEDTAVGIAIFLSFIIAIIAIPLSMSVYLSWRFASTNKTLASQLVEVQRLSAAALQHEAEKQLLLESRADDLEREVAIRTEELRRQRDKSDELLENILPSEVAEELKEKGSAAARLYDNVTVLFTDFEDFTQRAEALTPDALVGELNECFSAFDGIITRHGLEKIKTVGDAYIAVSGLPAANDRHAQDVVAAAIEVRDFMLARKEAHPFTFGIRLGLHSGSLVAGIVGVKKFAYDIWGDTVNTAARMEQHSEAGCINISAATYELVKDEFLCNYRGELEAKHKGKMGMYFVEN